MKGFPRFRDEFPIVAVCVKRELQDAERVRVADFAGRQRNREWPVALTSGADNKFADALRCVGFAVRILR